MSPIPRLSLRWSLSLLAILAACGDSTSPARPTNALTLVPVDSGLDFSILVTAPPDDPSRLFILQRDGRILLRKNGVRQDSAFLNLTALTSPATGEYGVYSLAFHPQYATNRRLFVYYADLNGDSQVAEYLADPTFDHADPASRKAILSQAQNPATVLYGGLLTFGPDGKLYLGFGDGHVYGQPQPTTAQDSTSLLGKILRLDVDGGSPYAIPADNPFVGHPGWREEIWALGLRNPWRWSFDRGTGDLWVGDVGENLWEEVTHVAAPAAGANLGWPIREGNHCYLPASGCGSAGLSAPVIEYPHSPACAVTGGYVYRGRAFPGLRGAYFYGDYCGGWVRSIRLIGGQAVPAYPPLASPLVNDNVVSFGEDALGEVYVVMASGRVYRVAEAS